MLIELRAQGPRCRLAEGPRWDSAQERLVWVDITSGDLHVATLEHGVLHAVHVHRVAATVGAAAPALDGSILTAAHDRLVVLHPDGRSTRSRRLVGSGHRFNDGAVDPAGRFLVGTLSLGDVTWDDRLLRLGLDGELTVIDDDLGLSNGLGWSADGSRMYSVDTARGTIYVRDYDVSSGAVGTRAVWLSFLDGHPDGLWVDAEDYVWVALWGLGAVHRYSPGGNRVMSVELPTRHVSALTFAGAELDQLVITTAADDLEDEEAAGSSDAGRIFLGQAPVPGLPCTPWAPVSLPA